MTFLGYNHTDKQGVYIDFVYWSSHVFEKQTERKDLFTKWTKKNMWQKRKEERTENSFKISITLLIQISTKKRSDYYLKRIFILESNVTFRSEFSFPKNLACFSLDIVMVLNKYVWWRQMCTANTNKL